MMFLKGLLAAACVSLGFSQSSVTLKDCSPGSVFTIDSLAFSPTVPVPGTVGTLVTSYNVLSEFTGAGAKSHYKCSLNGLPVYDETFDLCTQTTCPVKAGAHTDKSASQVPNTSGKVQCTIDWVDAAGTHLMCIEMNMKLASAGLRGFSVKDEL